MPANLLPNGGEAYFYPDFLQANEANRLLESLKNSVQWQQQPIKIFGKEVLQPRLTAWFANELRSYRYSGLEMQAQEWTSDLLEVKNKTEKLTGNKFNSALLNYYRDGNDSVGWHSDNEKSLGEQPAIASISLGENRRFELRNYISKKEIIKTLLTHGSLLLMKGMTQQFWEHQLPKDKKINGARINITFRTIQ